MLIDQKPLLRLKVLTNKSSVPRFCRSDLEQMLAIFCVFSLCIMIRLFRHFGGRQFFVFIVAESELADVDLIVERIYVAYM
jgi:hypothetical protein